MTRASLIARNLSLQEQRAAADLTRQVRTVTHAQGSRIIVDGRELINFASNDYLGLAQDPRLLMALQTAANAWGVGATASHFLGGHRAPHRQLEEEIADWLGYPGALLFSTGMMANLGVLSALLGRGDVCVQDKLNHASLIDAAKLSGATCRRFPHADVYAAERQLQSCPEAPALLVSDGVFSMDGDIAPLVELAALCQREHAALMIDDAHGIGVLGDQGGGSVAAHGLGPNEVPLLMVTLGKALGSFGAVVLADNDSIAGLMQFARSYIYTTAMPPALAAAGIKAVQLARTENWRREKLVKLIARFRHGVEQLGLAVMPSTTPIQPLLLGSAHAALRVAKHLETAGFYAPAIRPPTVADNASRLRITLSAAHEETEVDALLYALAAAKLSGDNSIVESSFPSATI